MSRWSCSLSHIIIKPQPERRLHSLPAGCSLSHIIIKPQPPLPCSLSVGVVLYLISSSNHNWAARGMAQMRLFFISYHHQTTTLTMQTLQPKRCSLSHIIIKPQLKAIRMLAKKCCSLSHIIIKPQRISLWQCSCAGCSLSHIIIKPQRQRWARTIIWGCSLSHIIIKPQRAMMRSVHAVVVLYLISSSNHNQDVPARCSSWVVLYLISSSNHNFMVQ